MEAALGAVWGPSATLYLSLSWVSSPAAPLRAGHNLFFAQGTQGSPRTPLAVAIRQITTTLYSVLLQFNTFQKKQIGCITLGKALGRVK